MNTKWTPGPWKIRNMWITDKTELVTIAKMECYSQFEACNSHHKVKAGQLKREADARLISLAPEMAEALRACLPFVDICRKVTGGEGDIAAANIRAMLAKLEE